MLKDQGTFWYLHACRRGELGYIAWRLRILRLKMCMAWPTGRMRSPPVSPRNGSARGKGFSSVCSYPLKSTQGEGGEKKTCRSRIVMYPGITINPYRAKEAAAGRLIPVGRHGTARHAPHPPPSPEAPHWPTCSATFRHGWHGQTTPGPGHVPPPRCQHLGQRLRGAPPRHGRPRWGRVARS